LETGSVAISRGEKRAKENFKVAVDSPQVLVPFLAVIFCHRNGERCYFPNPLGERSIDLGCIE